MRWLLVVTVVTVVTAVAVGGVASAAPARFSTAPRKAEARATLPKALVPLVPHKGIYAAGGGLTSGSWRVVVTLSGELRAAKDTTANSRSFEIVDSKAAQLDDARMTELVALADKAWREARKSTMHPTADYDEILIVADGDHVYFLQGFGPIRGGVAEELLKQLNAEADKAGEVRVPDAGKYAKLGSVALKDVQGLHGGQNVFVRADGACIVQVVAPGMVERRFRLQVDAAAVKELSRLLAKHAFFDIRVAARPGVPDEARPTITVALASGETKAIAKWANDKHADFDPVYAWLLALVDKARKGKPVHEGKFDWKWRPDGFKD